jgi:hypothetical protein
MRHCFVNEPLIMKPEEFSKLAHADIVKWDRVVRDGGVTVE